MSLQLSVELGFIQEPSDPWADFDVRWSTVEGDQRSGTIGRDSYIGLGRISPDTPYTIARGEFGISAEWSMSCSISKTDATPELMRAIRALLDLVATHPSIGVAIYLDVPILLWDGRNVTVNTRPSFANKIAGIAMSTMALEVTLDELPVI